MHIRVLTSIVIGQSYVSTYMRLLEMWLYGLSSCCKSQANEANVILYRTLASTAVLAYTLGLRHALDADHIAVRLFEFILYARRLTTYIRQ